VRVAASARCPLDPAGVARLARAVIRAEGGALAALSITFVGATRIRALHRQHVGRDRVTDVIAFTLGDAVGDVYVCVRVAAAHAARHGVTLREELRRLVIHGVLHALGREHPAGEERYTSPMWRRQERYLARFGALAR
jgi:probable rRNA maturation factor